MLQAGAIPNKVRGIGRFRLPCRSANLFVERHAMQVTEATSLKSSATPAIATNIPVYRSTYCGGASRLESGAARVHRLGDIQSEHKL